MTTMIGSASNFILNITELQNTITSAGGVNQVNQLSNTVAQLQQMLNYDTKSLAVNTISAYNMTPIQVTDSMNFASNANLTLNESVVVGGGSTGLPDYGVVSTIGFATSVTNYFSTTTGADTAISFQVGAGPAVTPLVITAAGGVLLPTTGTPGLGKYLTCMDSLGTAEWVTPAIPSDVRWKEDVRPMADYAAILEGIRGVRFRWTGLSGMSGPDVGLIAQDVLAVLPEAVIEGIDGRPHMVSYQKIVPVLVEAVKDLRGRVAALEEAAAAATAAACRP